MTRLRISNAATATLEDWLDQFMRGVLHYGELPSAVEAYLHLGHQLGRESRQSELDQLVKAYEQKLDMAYLWAFTPKERREEYQRRMDRYFAEQDAAFFAVPSQPNSNSIPIGADTLSAVERRPHDGNSSTAGQRAA